jgi:hypothetical protein
LLLGCCRAQIDFASRRIKKLCFIWSTAYVHRRSTVGQHEAQQRDAVTAALQVPAKMPSGARPFAYHARAPGVPLTRQRPATAQPTSAEVSRFGLPRSD